MPRICAWCDPALLQYGTESNIMDTFCMGRLMVASQKPYATQTEER